MQEQSSEELFDEGGQKDPTREKLMAMLDSFDGAGDAELQVGDKIEGTVRTIGSEYIFIDIGTRSEALMKKSEKTDKDGACSVQPGDTLTGFVAQASEGEIVLTSSLSGHKADTGELIDAMKNKTPVQGKVTGVKKGGLQVKIMGKTAFCPISQIELSFVEDVNIYLNKTLDFVITKVSEGGRNVVVSRQPILEVVVEERLGELEQGIAEKKQVTGTITRIVDFGLFVDIGSGIEGLVHISEASWIREENLNDRFKPGQEITCVVLKIERKKPLKNTKISLSIRQAQEDPWSRAAETFPVGSRIEGKVTRLAPFGAFVELNDSVEGLVHISEMSWGKKVKHPSDVVKEGDTVTVAVLRVDEEKRTVSLSLKDVQGNPWEQIGTTFPVGSTVTGTVASQTKYGFFIDLTDSITGLLPPANIAPDKKDVPKVGEKIAVTVASVDPEKQRISLALGMEEVQSDNAFVKDYLTADKPGKQDQKSSISEFGAALKAALKNNN